MQCGKKGVISFSHLFLFPLIPLLLCASWQSSNEEFRRLSPLPSIVISLSIFLSLSTSYYFSLFDTSSALVRSTSSNHRFLACTSGMGSDSTETLVAGLVAAQTAWWLTCTMTAVGFSKALCSLASFDNQILCQWTHLNLLFKIVPSAPDERARIFSTYFHVKMTNFAMGKPNEALLWGKHLKFIFVIKNSFQRYIIFLYLKVFAKKSHVFLDNL